MDQRRADILADLLLAGAPAALGGGLGAIRAQVQVTVPVLTLGGRSGDGRDPRRIRADRPRDRAMPGRTTPPAGIAS